MGSGDAGLDLGLGFEWDLEWLILVPVAILLWIVPLWRIVRRTGRHPALALIAAVPLTALILIWWLAFVDWPAQAAGQRSNNRSGT